MQVFIVRLGGVRGGARVEGSRSTATLTIPENDAPYGVIAFTAATSVAVETRDNGSSVTMVPVVRRLEFCTAQNVTLFTFHTRTVLVRLVTSE